MRRAAAIGAVVGVAALAAIAFVRFGYERLLDVTVEVFVAAMRVLGL